MGVVLPWRCAGAVAVVVMGVVVAGVLVIFVGVCVLCVCLRECRQCAGRPVLFFSHGRTPCACAVNPSLLSLLSLLFPLFSLLSSLFSRISLLSLFSLFFSLSSLLRFSFLSVLCFSCICHLFSSLLTRFLSLSICLSRFLSLTLFVSLTLSLVLSASSCVFTPARRQWICWGGFCGGQRRRRGGWQCRGSSNGGSQVCPRVLSLT